MKCLKWYDGERRIRGLSPNFFDDEFAVSHYANPYNEEFGFINFFKKETESNNDLRGKYEKADRKSDLAHHGSTAP